MIRKKWIDGEAKGYLVTPILPGRWHEGRGNDPLSHPAGQRYGEVAVGYYLRWRL